MTVRQFFIIVQFVLVIFSLVVTFSGAIAVMLGGFSNVLVFPLWVLVSIVGVHSLLETEM